MINKGLKEIGVSYNGTMCSHRRIDSKEGHEVNKRALVKLACQPKHGKRNHDAENEMTTKERPTPENLSLQKWTLVR